jgi:hypothetical protein
MTKPPAPRLRDELEKQLTEELRAISTGNDPETNKPYSITAKARVWDRILKLEAIKAKLQEGDWGSGFDK